jgi:ribosomal protein S18 acetylase RimI-like enzyme
MRAVDIPAVLAVAERVHPDFPEDAAVFEERLRLYPQGCLVCGRDDAIAAYLVSHPWRAFDPPKLNTMLGQLPVRAKTYYIHDIALLPELRGQGVANMALEMMLARAMAERLSSISLIAVNGSAGFWQRHGFQDAGNAALTQKLRSYDDAAAFMMRHLDRMSI